MLLHNYIFYNWLFRLKIPFKNIVFRGHAYRTSDRYGQRLSISTNEKIITEHLIIQQIRYHDRTATHIMRQNGQLSVVH